MNECGDCTACCEVYHIPEISKPKNTMCSNCTGLGCGIYNTRPKTCKDYHCMYIRGNMNTELRPDKCGVILELLSNGSYQASLFRGEVYEGDPIMNYINLIQEKNSISINLVDTRR